MKFIKSLLIILLFYSTVQGQIKFQKTFLGSSGIATVFMQQCNDSGYVIAATSNFGIYVVRTNSAGDTLWTNMYVDTNGSSVHFPFLNCIRQTSDHGFMIIGSVNGKGYYLRIDSVGNRLWSGLFDDDSVQLYNVLQQDSGGFLISGYNNGPMSHDDSFFLSVNDSGALTTNTITGTGDSGVLNFIETKDSGIVTYVYDQQSSFNGIEKHGGTLISWSLSIPGYASVIVALPDTGYAAASYTQILRVNSTGNSLWTINPNIGRIRDMVYIDSLNNSGYALLSSDTVSSYNQDRIHLTRTDTSGNIIWTKTYDGFNFSFPVNLVYSKDGGFAFAGITNSVAENSAIIFIKTDSFGNIQ
jgi:hypothetical protein